MAWLSIPLGRGRLKLRPKSQMRTVELTRRVPVLDLGPIIISWWNAEAVQRDIRERTPGRTGIKERAAPKPPSFPLEEE
jgi:hypothetical protein